MAATDEGEGNVKQLAAYRLGYQSWMLSYWLELFHGKPEFEWGTAEGMQVAVEVVAIAITDLAPEIPVNSYGDLRAWADEQHGMWTRIVASIAAYSGKMGPWNKHLVRKARPASIERLRVLLNIAFAEIPLLRPWFQLGALIGQYQRTLDHHQPGSALPALDGIVASARTLSKQAVGSQARFFLVLQDSENASPQLSPRAFLTRVIEATGATLHNDVYGPRWDGFVVGNLLRALDRAIQDMLEVSVSSESEIALIAMEPAQESLKPQWVKQQEGRWVGELRLGDRVIRKIKHAARNVVTVLDVFEEEGWPPSILDPLTGSVPQKRFDTLRSLKIGLEGIRFYCDGTNESICWERL